MMSGRLDASQVEQARAVLDGLSGTVIVDLTNLNYISSAGLGLLIAAFNRLRNNGGELRLANPNELVRNVLRLSRIDRLIPVE
jgi:anti-sigma B factor antagonist